MCVLSLFCITHVLLVLHTTFEHVQAFVCFSANTKNATIIFKQETSCMLGCFIFLNLLFVYFDTFKNLSCIFRQCVTFKCMAFQQLLVIALNDQVHQVFDM